jgi:hypothetical protein
MQLYTKELSIIRGTDEGKATTNEKGHVTVIHALISAEIIVIDCLPIY